MRVIAAVAVRMGSSRLSGKTLRKVADEIIARAGIAEAAATMRTLFDTKARLAS